jgi:hypothetical protein
LVFKPEILVEKRFGIERIYAPAETLILSPFSDDKTKRQSIETFTSIFFKKNPGEDLSPPVYPCYPRRDTKLSTSRPKPVSIFG